VALASAGLPEEGDDRVWQTATSSNDIGRIGDRDESDAYPEGA